MIELGTVVDVPGRQVRLTALELLTDSTGNADNQTEVPVGPYMQDRAMVVSIDINFEGQVTYGLQSIYTDELYDWSADDL